MPAIRIAAWIGGGRSSTSLEVAGEVACEVVERAAGGRDVDEPEQRRAQLGVVRRQLHRALVDNPKRMARPPGQCRVDRAADLQKLRLHDSESYWAGYRASMPSLVLGPVLRYVGETEAVVWVETDSACEVEILGTRERTFCVCGHHYALVCCGDLEPGSWHEYEVLLDGERVWPRDDGWPASAFNTYPKDSALRIVFGSCRVAAPHQPPYSLKKDEDERGREIDALHTLAVRMRDEPREDWPDVLLMLGDQVYADEVSPATRAFIETRRDLSEPPGDCVLDFEEYTQLYLESWSDPAIRWLLSTVSTMMIFDDHDVHDDWNISQAWLEEARSTTGGTSTSRVRCRRTGSTSTWGTSRRRRTRTTSS